ncbi:Shedu anti-phage system protein SduA domain-containing protein [Nocardia carnea]|uniref:Shedu anti-phage system protein SduA domain-containing protein n=1 Tax=Nocardia carnea TaxID=37328 RepID=A0ABW7TX53_9NOCA|nr:Shedu anti-phage system protein SduA domain-containing protein [Nocardia carnea]
MIFEVAVRALKDVGQLVLDRDEIQTAEDFLNGLVSQLEDGRFVHAPADRPGRYRIVRGTAEMAVWLDRIFRNRLDFEDPAEAARRVVMSPEAMTVLANEDAGIHLLKAAELKRKSSILRGVRGVIEDATATEHDLQCALQAHPWIFGGHYIGAEIRRRLVPGDEIDVPLIRSDGSLHVVELKKARGAQPIVKRHRGSWVPTAAVHDAAAQAINYLVGLDEDRVRIRREFGIETRRSSALVLIGHPAIHPEIPEETICEVLRTFNSHMSRVEVLTYKELIDSAERVLGYDSDSAAL